jgi:hypothetical protein
MLRMELHWRTLMTREQIENISDYNSDLKYKSKHLIKEQAYQSYLMNGDKESFLRSRCETALYRVKGENIIVLFEQRPHSESLNDRQSCFDSRGVKIPRMRGTASTVGRLRHYSSSGNAVATSFSSLACACISG